MLSFRRLPFPSLPRPLLSLTCHALVGTIEASKVINHGVNVLCQATLAFLLNETPGSSATSATTINVHIAKGMISMENDRTWENWCNERIWKLWQTL